MIIVHAAVYDGNLNVWAEKSANGRKAGAGKSAARRGTGPQPKLYEFAAEQKDLLSAFAEAATMAKPDKKRFQDLTAWLPAIGNKIVPSSPLIEEPSTAQANTQILPRGVKAFRMLWPEVFDLLCACAGKKLLARGVLIGEDLAFWSDALRFAGSMVARQQFLPGVRSEEHLFRAVWKPVYGVDDSEAVTRLAKRMPAVARALSAVDATEPPNTPAVDVVRSFVEAALDYLVRTPIWRGRILKRSDNFTNFESIHDAWLHALRVPDNVIHWETKEVALLAEQIWEYSRPIAAIASSPFRLCFRLEEPPVPEPPQKGKSKQSPASWYVRYLLQSREDPSLLLPTDTAWKQNVGKVRLLEAAWHKVKEYLLTSLGQASALCPGVAESLKTAQPAGYALDASGAHQFLVDTAVLLQQSGFGVMLPAWWTGKGSKMRLSARASVKSPRVKSGAGLSLGEIVQFDWEISIGRENITLEELQALAKLKAPLVQIRGQWVETSPEQIQAAADLWTKKKASGATVKDVVQMALGVKDAPDGLEFEGVKATGWIGSMLKQLGNAASLKELPPAASFSGELRPYQRRGLSWLGFLSQWGLGACLADDMGLGKTVQTLALIQRNWNSNGKLPALLVCPTTVVSNWQKEAARFTPDLPVLIHHGVARTKGAEFKKEAEKHAVVISSYGLLHRDFKLLQDIDWSGVILDEAQNIKNAETKQAHAARSLKADFRIALTGTPVENNVGDLWSIMEFLNPGFLGTQAEFKRKFFVAIQAERDPAAAERLKKITGPFILRRLKTDKSIIADLPDKMEMKAFCPLTKEQGSLYAAVVRETEAALAGAEGIQRKGLVLATLSKLKQVCNHPAHFLGDNSAIPGRSGKLARLTEMLEEILEIGDRALVFTQFAEMGKILRKHLQDSFGTEVLFLHGATTKQNRDRMVERFQMPSGGPSIFILSLKAGGTGLNLTAANHVFHFDRWWNPAVENQATDRAFRIGQTKNVQVHKFVCAGTLEEKIDEMIERKKDVAEKVIGTGEGWLTELSNKELKELWKLRKEALGD